LQTQAVSSSQIINEFINCYRSVLREQLSLPQVVVLLELMDQNEVIIAEIRASEQRFQQFIYELQANHLSPQNLSIAYLQGQQQLAITLAEETKVDADQASQVIQARLQPTPALFSTGLCKGLYRTCYVKTR
jgi:hypothetical protein